MTITGGKVMSRRSHSASDQGLRVQERWMLWAFFLSMGLDFRSGVVGGGGIQYAIALVCFLSGILFAMQRKPYPGSRALQGFTIAWWGFMCLNALSALTAVASGLSNSDLDRYFRVGTPYFLIGITLSVVQTYVRKRIPLHDLVRSFLFCTLISVVFRYAYSRVGLGIDEDSTRWQVLSPYSILGFSFGLVWLLFHKRFNALLLLNIAIIGISILLSVTRTFILVGLVSCGASVLCLVLSKADSALYRVRRFTTTLIAAILIASLVGLITLLVRPKVFETWSQRTKQVQGHVDPSYLARQLFNSGIWMDVRKSTFTYFFGEGIGAGFYADNRYAPEYTRISGRFPDKENSTGVDSRLMTNILYAGLAGTAYTVALYLYAFFYSMRAIVRQTTAPESSGLWASVPFIAYMGYVPFAALYDPLQQRGGGVAVGILFGLAITFGDGSLLRTPSSEHNQPTASDATELRELVG